MLSLCDHQRRRTRNTRPTRNRFSLSSFFRTFRDRIPNSTHKIRRYLRGHPSIRIIRFPMLQIDPPCTYLNNDSQRGETGLSATRLDSLDPRSPLDPPRNWQERWVVFSPFSFFSFVFRPAPSRSIKIRPVSRDVDAFSEAGWALPVRPGERGGIPHRRRVRETRGRARAIPMRTPAQVLSALAAIALSHGAKVHVAPRRITIVLCCAIPPLPFFSLCYCRRRRRRRRRFQLFFLLFSFPVSSFYIFHSLFPFHSSASRFTVRVFKCVSSCGVCSRLFVSTRFNEFRPSATYVKRTRNGAKRYVERLSVAISFLLLLLFALLVEK